MKFPRKDVQIMLNIPNMTERKDYRVILVGKDEESGVQDKDNVQDKYSAQGVLGRVPTVGEALAEARRHPDEPVCIRLAPGVYREKLVFDIPGLLLEGEDPARTVLCYGDYAKKQMPDGSSYGTFRTASVRIDADDFTAKNITFENTAGSGPEIGQALALYAEGDRLIFDNCRLLGGQDTLFTAPLPLKEIQPGGFKGPKEFAPRRPGRHYYRRCFLCGDVDFIFGGAAAYFEKCEIFSKNRGQEINGFVTAASTPEGQTYGYVFDRCRFTGDCQPESVYLGRPWRDHAKTVILNSYLGAHIRREGWHDWDKPAAHETAFYAEFGNYGEGADPAARAEWSHQLTAEEAKEYTRENVLGEWIRSIAGTAEPEMGNCISGNGNRG